MTGSSQGIQNSMDNEQQACTVLCQEEEYLVFRRLLQAFVAEEFNHKAKLVDSHPERRKK